MHLECLKDGFAVEQTSSVELEYSCLKLGGTELRSPVHVKKLLPSISLRKSGLVDFQLEQRQAQEIFPTYPSFHFR